MTDERNTPTPDPEDLDVDAREAEEVKGGKGYVITSLQHSATDRSYGKPSPGPSGYIGETEKN